MNIMTTKATQSNIGRMARIEHKAVLLVGNVLDLVAGTDNPKRIRIQHGDPTLQGHVVFPGEYAFLGWADEEED